MSGLKKGDDTVLVFANTVKLIARCLCIITHISLFLNTQYVRYHFTVFILFAFAVTCLSTFVNLCTVHCVHSACMVCVCVFCVCVCVCVFCVAGTLECISASFKSVNTSIRSVRSGSREEQSACFSALFALSACPFFLLVFPAMRERLKR